MNSTTSLHSRKVSEAYSLYVSGLSSQKLATMYDVHVTTIRGWFRKAKLPMKTNKYEVNDQAFSVLSSQSAYWVGFIMADGCIYNNTVTIEVATKDLGHLSKFKDFISSTHPIYDTMRGLSPSARFTFSSKQVVNDLATLGIVPRKSYTSEVAEVLAFNRDFWRGVLDGDGYLRFSEKQGNLEVSLTGSLNLLSQFRNVCELWGVSTSKVKDKGRYGVVSVRGGNAILLTSKLYQGGDLCLDRKSSVAQQIIQFTKRR